MLVLDANVAFRACMEENGFRRLGRQRLVAPPLMWSEARSSLHLGVWRATLPPAQGREALNRLESAPVERRDHENLGPEAWAVADELGWARTYDAEYVALARLLGCKLVTLDQRLRRGADRLGLVLALDELGA